MKARTTSQRWEDIQTAKPASRRQKLKFWAWQASPAFATAFLFIIASLCLLYGSCLRLFSEVSLDVNLLRSQVLWPYFIGGVFFTTGCAIPLPRTNAQWQVTTTQLKRRLKHRNEREVDRAKMQQHWAWLDHVGQIIAVTGGLFINTGSYIDLRRGSKAEMILTKDVDELWSITAPVMFGRALFMISGWFIWAARNKGWRLVIRSSTSYFWWTSVLFWTGASGFYIGWFVTSSPFEFLPQIFVKNWFGICIGYILGSCQLFAASYIMMLELANKEERQIKELDLEDQPLITV